MSARRETLRAAGAVLSDCLVRRAHSGDKVTAKANATNRGQAMVEFSLVIALLLLLLFGIVDFSRLFFAYATMAHGVREGARWGVVHGDNLNAIADLAESRMVVIGGTASVDRTAVTMTPDDVDGDSRCSHYCRLVVRARATLDVWTPVLPSVEIVAQSTMHFE
jgi:hypothetical protein